MASKRDLRFGRWVQPLVWVGGLCVLLCAWVACTPGEGAPCQTSVDCGGAFCIAGKCTECTEDTHCKDGKVCTANRCLAPGAEPPSPDAPTQDQGTDAPVTPEVDASTPESTIEFVDPPGDEPPTDFTIPDNGPTGPPPAVCAGRTNCCVPSRLQLQTASETIASTLASYRPLIAWSTDGKVFASATMNQAGRVEIRNGTTFGYTRAWTAHASGILGIALDATGTLLATASYDRTVKIWNVADGKLKWTLKGHGSYVYGVAFSRDSKRVVSAGIYDYTAKVWDLTTGKLIKSLRDSQYVYDVAFTKSSNQIVLSGLNKLVSLWDVTTGKKVRSYVGNGSHVRTLDVSPDGTMLITGSDDRKLQLFNLSTGKLIRTFTGHTAPVYHVRFSPDGKKVASAGSYDFTMRTWLVSTGKVLDSFKNHPTYVSQVAWAPDSTKVLSATYAKWVRRWTLGTSTGQKILDLHYDIVASLAIGPKGEKLVAAPVKSNTAQIIQVSDHKVLATLTGHKSYVSSIAYSKDGKWIVTGSWDKTVKIWSAAGKLVRTLGHHTGAVYAVAISADGNTVASGSSDRTIRLVNRADGKLLRTLKGHTGTVRAVAFNHDASVLASGSSDSTIRVWDVKSGVQRKLMNDHQVGVYAVAFNKDGTRLVSGGWDRQLYLWSMPEGTLERSWTVQSALIHQVAFLPNDSIVSVSLDRYVRIYSVPAIARTHAMNKHTGMVTGLAIHPTKPLIYSIGTSGAIYGSHVGESPKPAPTDGIPSSLVVTPDNQYALIGTDGGTIEMRGLLDGKLVRTINAHSARVRALRLSVDGLTLFSVSEDMTAKAWSVEDGKLLRTFKGHTDLIYGLDVHPDGKSIATGAFDGTIRQWDIATGKLILTYKDTNGSGRVFAVAFSPSGKLLAAGNYEKRVFVWNVGDPKPTKTLYTSAVRGGVTSLAWWNDTYLYAGYFDSYIRQWRLSDNRLYRTLSGQEGPIRVLAIRADNAALISGSDDHTLRLWRTSDGLNQSTALGHKDLVTGIAFAGGMVVSVSEDKTMRRWYSIASFVADAIILGSAKTGINAVGISPDGKWALSGGQGGRARHYAVTASKYLRAVIGGSNPVTATAFTADSTIMAAAVDKYVYTWKATTTTKAEGTGNITISQTTGPPSIAFSADGKLVLTTSNETNDIRRWKFADRKLEGTIKGHTKPVFRLARDTGGKFLLSASRDNSVRLWDGKTWAPIRTLPAVGRTIVDADISSDAAFVAVLAAPGTLSLMKPDGTPHKSMTSQTPMTQVRFGGSGAWVAVGYHDGSTRIFATSDLRLLQHLRPQTMPINALDAAASGRGLIVGNTGGFSLSWRCP